MAFTYIITGALMGIVMGFAMEKGRVFEPGMMIGQFQMRNFIVLKMFLSAVATTLVVMVILTAVGAATLHPKAAIYPATILGGLLFGAGMGLVGACPGTVAAQIGAGYNDAWMVLVGGFLGAMAYGYVEPAMSAWNTGPGKITLEASLGVPFITLAIIAVVLIVVALFILERFRPWRHDLGDDYNGFFPE